MAKKQLAASEMILGSEAILENEGKGKRPETRGRKKYLDPSEVKSKQTTLLLRESTFEILKDEAWRRRTSLNELATQILETWINENLK